MAGNKYVKIIDNEGTTVLNEEIENLYFLEFEEEDPQSKTSTQEIVGTDGVIPSITTFEPFKLTLRFAYVGESVKDYHLFKTRLRGLIYKRDPYYIVHSDYPGRKYAVIPNAISHESDFPSSGKINIDFTVFKGYSESLKDTSEFSLSSSDWQFENGVLSDSNIKYKHDTTAFKIYNGSTETINPILRHSLKIVMHIESPNGFKIHNKTTGEVFEYKKATKSTKPVVLNGVHPFVDNQRVGIDTNRQWITLVPGFNEIEILGTNIKSAKTQWIFPFIYK